MATTAAKSIGREAERLAEKHLVGNGLTLVERNFNCRHGEIDLIMRSRDTLVFVEVRRRQASKFASAAATVDQRKQDKLVRAAGIYLGRRREFRNFTIRFDVLAIDGINTKFTTTKTDNFTVQWLQDAFRPGSSKY